MNKLYFLIAFFCFSIVTIAQENKSEPKEPIVKFSGYITYEAFMDTYESVTSREGDIYLYPVRQALNSKGDDIKAYNQLNMISAQSRVRAKVNGPEAFGAKVNGTLEFDFLGKGDDYTQMPRIRHMFMSLNWEKTQLTLGQTWHPVFVTECFPQVISMGAALPFNPFNRSPQIKLSYKLSDNLYLVGAALSHLDHKSKGPALAQNNAVVPDFHGQFKYVSANFNAGLVAGYKMLKPRNMLADSTLTSETVGSFDVAAFAKIKVNDLTFKLYGIYGQNTSAYTMIGGYGAAHDPTTVADYAYSNINTMAVWSELMYESGAMGYGLFAGYSANLGTSTTDYYNLDYTRGGNIDNIIRVSPRATYTSGKVIFGLEYMLTTATYMDLVPGKYEAKVTDDAVMNHRIYFSAKYTF